jgi:hypothetical protein
MMDLAASINVVTGAVSPWRLNFTNDIQTGVNESLTNITNSLSTR